MSYEEELRAKLDAVRPVEESDEHTIDVASRERQLFDELEGEFEFSSYDLEESDVLRTMKIVEILAGYNEVFAHKDALKLFYTLARIDIVTPKNLLGFMKIPTARFKTVVQAMAKHKLVFINDDGELELTLDGKSLASRIGIDIYF
jgi:hypothetical protein